MRSTRGHRGKRYSRFNQRLDPRLGRRDPNPKRLVTRGGIAGLAVVTALFILGMVLAHSSQTGNPDASAVQAQAAEMTQPSPANTAEPRHSAGTVNMVSETFSHCGLVRRTCVVDGDTFWLHGQKIRMADIDTPEVSQPQCAAEKALGGRATDRLVALLSQGPFEMTSIGDRDEDRYGRKLRVIVRGGRSLGDQLVAEGLARTWTGKREPWC
jgi:endonuclease YncB( thermonuclease family)